MIKIIIISIILIMGLIFFCKNSTKSTIENFSNSGYRCPNLLIKKHNDIYLYNSNEAKVPGVNPIRFNNLEDYAEFLEWQRSQNINCPVLYLEKTYNAQNNAVYNVKENPFQQPDVNLSHLHFSMDLLRPGNNPIKGTATLDNAGTSHPPFNQKDYPAFDPYNQYIGLKTPLDKIFHEKGPVSDNPMDPNWGGHNVTQAAVKSGKFKSDYVYKLAQSAGEKTMS